MHFTFIMYSTLLQDYFLMTFSYNSIAILFVLPSVLMIFTAMPIVSQPPDWPTVCPVLLVPSLVIV